MENSALFREFRDQLKSVPLSESKAAQRLNVTGSYLNRVLSGKVKPSVELVGQIKTLNDTLKSSGLVTVQA